MTQEKPLLPSRSRLESLGQRLRWHRLHLGLSQEALAEALEVSTRSIRRWEQDQAIPQEVARTRICQLFGIEPESLLFGAARPIEKAPPVLPRPWYVPYLRNPFFTGRQDLLHSLHEKLSQEHSMALTQSWAISGLGGIGKTQIALEYAYQYCQDYTAVFWVSAATQETLQADLVTIAEFLQLPEKDDHDHNRVILAVKKWLITHQDWLLILDNADDVAVVGDILPAERSGHLLLTSRAQALGSVAQRIEVETMGLAEGTLFLLRRARILAPLAFLDHASQEQLAAAEAIVIEMDFLPLALDQAGAYIEEVGCSLRAYLELYRTHRGELLQRRGHVPSDHPEPVATTWSLNFQRIAQINPAAAHLLRLCAFLEPDAIPEELISEGSAVLGPLLNHIAADMLALNEAIEELRKFSLVQRDPETGLLRIHRLVQAVLKDAMEPEDQRQWAERTVRATACVFPEAIEAANWPRCRRFLSQAQMCSVLIQDFALVFEEAASLLHRTASYLFDVALYEQSEPLFQRAVRIWEQVHGPEHPDMARSLYGLAELYRTQGKYEQAEQLYQRALHIWEQTLGPEHPDMAWTLNGLATLYQKQGKYEQAKPLFQRALHIWEQTLGPEHSNIAYPLNGLGILYKIHGQYEQAESLYQRALHIRQRALGPDHPDLANILNNLASMYDQQGLYEKAEPLYQRALHIWEQALGPEYPNVAFALNNLADIYLLQGKYEQAEPLYQRALHIWEQTGGPEYPNVAFALNGLANLYGKRGMEQQAESLYQRALSILEHTLGEHHLETARTLYDFAEFQEAWGKLQEAAALYQRALATREQVLGPDHPSTIETRTAYANLQREALTRKE